MTIAQHATAVRVKQLCLPTDERASGNLLPLLSVSIHHGVVPRSSLTSDEPRADDLANYKVCRAGDLVLNRMRAFQGAVGVSSAPGLVSPDYLVLRPCPGVDPNWLHHLFRSGSFVGEMIARLRGIGGTDLGTVRTPRINADDLADIRVWMPSLVEQRRIAAFLDVQVTRIDQIIALRGRQIALEAHRFASRLEELLVAHLQDVRVLSSLTDPSRQIQYGIVLPGPDFPGGIPIIKGGDVAAHRMSPDLLNRTDPLIEAGYSRSRVRCGDILIAIRGSVGELAVVPEALTGSNITQDAALVAPHNCDPIWLRWALQTPTVQGRIRRMVTGATVKGINIGDLRRISVPHPKLSEQRELGEAANRMASEHGQLTTSCSRSVVLLDERKRSLITAAVTGEFDVSSASTRALAGVAS